jgi:hypothetical protein
MNTHSILLNGIDGYVNLGNPQAINDIGTGDFTIEARIRCKNEVVSSSYHQPIVTKSTFATGDWGFNLNAYYDDHRLTFHFDSTGLTANAGGAKLNGDVWKRVAVTRSGSTVKFFIDGVNTSTFTGVALFSISNVNDLIIGARVPFSVERRFNGNIDEVIFWNVARSEAQFLETGNRSLLDSELLDPTLIAYWAFNEGSGTTVFDSSQNGIDGTLNGGVTFSTDIPFTDPIPPEPDTWLGTKVFQSTDYYNVIDFNRENINAEYLRLKLIDKGYVTNFTKPVRNLLRSDFPYVETINDLRSNINALINIYTTKTALPIIISSDQVQVFDCEKANELELPQQEIYELIDLMEQLYRYSGTFSAGQEVNL